ncbi:MAG: FAD-binding oxidoreductase [Candidatus Rokubacteria bacterium]|nr:FAD-binding oxidoreductase [Candidatus Rokubacteria bacterium]MBI3104673.1 FAD-binding oxidoreductase [Candidatus Rokubacteria bacterium]
MAVSAPALREALAAIVGADCLVSDAAALAALAVDGVTPRWAARPGSVEEVSRLLALASAEGLHVIPRGSGSSLDCGMPPGRVDLLVDCGRLSAILDHSPEDMVATVQAGLSLAALGAALGRHRQRFPVDPVGGASRSIGGLLATGATGPLRFRHGGGRDLLLGLRFVQADGTSTWGGSKVVKSVTGYDVPKLLVGSFGTLGVIVEATIRLHAMPPASGAWLLSFASHASAAAFVAGVLDSTLQPERMVVLNGPALKAAARPQARAAVAISVGSSAEAVESQGGDLRRLATGQGATVSAIPDDFWLELGAALAGPIRLRLGGEPSKLCFWLEEMERLAGEAAVPVSALGEAGSGAVRAALGRAALNGGWLPRAVASLREGLSAEGGYLVVERAPREVKDKVDVWGPISPDSLDIMKRIKRQFDPSGILSPGRFVGGL